MLRGLLESLGCEVNDLGIVPDDLQSTRDALTSAASRADLIVSSGGVSVGEEDHVKPAVQAEGTLDLWQIAMKPGKPLAFGHVRGCRLLDCRAIRFRASLPSCCLHGPLSCGGKEESNLCGRLQCGRISIGGSRVGVASSCGRDSTTTVDSIFFRIKTLRC